MNTFNKMDIWERKIITREMEKLIRLKNRMRPMRLFRGQNAGKDNRWRLLSGHSIFLKRLNSRVSLFRTNEDNSFFFFFPQLFIVREHILRDEGIRWGKKMNSDHL